MIRTAPIQTDIEDFTKMNIASIPVPSLAELQKMEVHPMAARFPMWSRDRLNDLAADIAENGQHIAIVVWREKAMLLDGRNRLAACAIAGIEPKVEFFDGEDPRKLIISRNIQTREMTASQKAMLLAVEFPEPGKRGPKKRNSSESETIALGFSPALLSDARLVVKYAGDLAERVSSGSMKFDVALKQAVTNKQKAASDEARFASLQDRATDLARQVVEDTLTLDEAEAAHRERERVAAMSRDAGKRAVERLNNITADIVTIASAIKAGQTDLISAELVAMVEQARSDLESLMIEGAQQ